MVSNAKQLTIEDVRNIENDGRTIREIARAWGISTSVVFSIRHGTHRLQRMGESRVTPTRPPLNFSKEDIEAIQNDERSYRAIAADYKIAPASVMRIKKGLVGAKTKRKLRMDG